VPITIGRRHAKFGSNGRQKHRPGFQTGRKASLFKSTSFLWQAPGGRCYRERCAPGVGKMIDLYQVRRDVIAAF
jgi:hypothetical protein